MSVDFYTLRKRGVRVIQGRTTTGTVHFLQLVIRNALSPDAQSIIDAAIKNAFEEWGETRELPELVVQVGSSGRPEPGAPIFRWGRKRRVYCFDDELIDVYGYLGERELGGFLFRTVQEQEYINDQATARSIDEGGAKVYKDFWAGETFKTGDEFLAYRHGRRPYALSNHKRRESSPSMFSAKLGKIVHLIRFIESKGNAASPADLQFLGSLRHKAIQLGYAGL